MEPRAVVRLDACHLLGIAPLIVRSRRRKTRRADVPLSGYPSKSF
jgi:hypothetical protein